MNCPQSHDLLQKRLDGIPIVDRTALDRHLAVCSECRQLHAVAVRLEDGLRLLSPPVPPADLAARIVGQVSADRRRRLAVRRGAIAGALAAGLLLAIWLGQRPNRSGVVKVAVTGPIIQPSAVVAKRSPEVPSLRVSVAEVGSAVASLTRRAADETVGQTKLLLPETIPAPPLTTSEPMQPVIEPPTESLRQAGQGMSAALDPVATSARRAFSLFLREASAMAPEDTDASEKHR
jgi:hypothetical protein